MGRVIDELRSVYGPPGSEDEVPERGTMIDHFVVLDRIGEGAMGIVLAAYDAKTLQELWSHNVGAGINAPPITYSVNGKQYVAVLVGARERPNLYPETPELKNVAPAHLLFVFGL